MPSPRPNMKYIRIWHSTCYKPSPGTARMSCLHGAQARSHISSQISSFHVMSIWISLVVAVILLNAKPNSSSRFILHFILHLTLRYSLRATSNIPSKPYTVFFGRETRQLSLSRAWGMENQSETGEREREREGERNKERMTERKTKKESA